MESKIPKTGKIGRFARILENETDQKLLENVMLNAGEYGSFNHAQKAAW